METKLSGKWASKSDKNYNNSVLHSLPPLSSYKAYLLYLQIFLNQCKTLQTNHSLMQHTCIKINITRTLFFLFHN